MILEPYETEPLGFELQTFRLWGRHNLSLARWFLTLWTVARETLLKRFRTVSEETFRLLKFFINVSEPFLQRFSRKVSETFLKNCWKRSCNASKRFSAPLRVDILTFQKPFWNVLETFLFWFLWFEWNVSETFLKRFLLCWDMCTLNLKLFLEKIKADVDIKMWKVSNLIHNF